MKHYTFLILAFLVVRCSTENSDLIRGKWYYTDNDTKNYIRITRNEFIIENDSPVPEQYKIKGDTIIKGFENYSDTLIIIKLTKDSLILKSNNGNYILIKNK